MSLKGKPTVISLERELQSIIEMQHKDIILMKKKLEQCKTRVEFQHFEAVLKELQEERAAHAATQVQLLEYEEKVEKAKNENRFLEHKLQAQQDQFARVVKTLQSNLLNESQKNVELENRCSALARVMERKAEKVESHEKHIEDLSSALHETAASYSCQLDQLLLEQQQNAYISSVLQAQEEQQKKGNESQSCVTTDTHPRLLQGTCNGMMQHSSHSKDAHIWDLPENRDFGLSRTEVQNKDRQGRCKVSFKDDHKISSGTAPGQTFSLNSRNKRRP